jgi:hypothetical protein
MGADVTHWDRSAWRENLDEFVLDPRHPQAFPARRPIDLLGRIRVRLSAEDRHLVAYGFGGQRVAIPSAGVGAVQVVEAVRTGRRKRTPGPARAGPPAPDHAAGARPVGDLRRGRPRVSRGRGTLTRLQALHPQDQWQGPAAAATVIDDFTGARP